jgi:hypothetical protein
MTNQELEEIKARYEATTVAPWVSFIEDRDFECGSSFIMTGIPKGENIWSENRDKYIWGENRGEDLYLTGGTNADLDFIAHARQDIPRLLEEIERLKIKLRDLEKNGLRGLEE